MYHTVIKNKIRREGVLHEAMLELTYRCNLDCFFCYNDRKLQGDPLTVGDYERVLDELRDMGVLFLALTGGEPLVHRDFFAIGSAARDRGFAIRVKTGAHGLAGRLAERLKQEVDPLQTEISLHGATADAHDRQTRVPGSFDKLMAAVPELLSLDLRPAFVTTLTAWNEHQVEEMFDLADGLGVRLRFQGPVAPRDDGDTTPFAIQPSPAGWDRLTEVSRERRGSEDDTAVRWVSDTPVAEEADSKSPHCGAGSEEVLINPYGEVFPCLHMRNSAGNVHSRSIKEIWNSVVFRDARDRVSRATDRLADEGPLHLLGAPVYCPGLEARGCACSSPGRKNPQGGGEALVSLRV